MKPECFFCKLVRGEVKSYKFWEDDNHVAVLTPFPNTVGFTVVITKEHYPSYCFNLDDKVLSDLIVASKKVGKLLDRKLEDVGRTGLIMEGFGVDHAHAKLFPMHGTANMKEWKPILSKQKNFFERYEGYISSHDGEKMADDELERIAALLRR